MRQRPAPPGSKPISRSHTRSQQARVQLGRKVTLLALGKIVLFLSALLIAARATNAEQAQPPLDPARPVSARDERREIEIPKNARFVTAEGAIAVVSYNDMRDILETVGATFTTAHPEVRFAFDLRGTRFAPAAL